MHFNPIVLGLVASASAIDISFFRGWDCSGTSFVCTAIDPEVCCGGGGVSEQSVLVNWVPLEWHILAEGYGAPGCGAIKARYDMAGRTDLCMGVTSRGDYTGAKYFFVGRKREEGEIEGEDKNCTSVRPDTLVLADGITKYNIVDLDDAKIEELAAISDSGVGPEGIPEEFQALRK